MKAIRYFFNNLALAEEFLPPIKNYHSTLSNNTLLNTGRFDKTRKSVSAIYLCSEVLY
jgi:hypothetical protein